MKNETDTETTGAAPEDEKKLADPEFMKAFWNQQGPYQQQQKLPYTYGNPPSDTNREKSISWKLVMRHYRGVGGAAYFVEGDVSETFYVWDDAEKRYQKSEIYVGADGEDEWNISPEELFQAQRKQAAELTEITY